MIFMSRCSGYIKFLEWDATVINVRINMSQISVRHHNDMQAGATQQLNKQTNAETNAGSLDAAFCRSFYTFTPIAADIINGIV